MHFFEIQYSKFLFTAIPMQIPIQLPVKCGQFNSDWTKREPIFQFCILRSHWLCDNQ